MNECGEPLVFFEEEYFSERNYCDYGGYGNMCQYGRYDHNFCVRGNEAD